MASWDDGYVTDVGYTDHFHRETTPAWLAMAALLLGYRPPDLAKPFRYADLGCGNGLTALIVAATTPQAGVWAFDFNPAHIEAGRTMAAAAGLTNIRFEEASFAQIAAMPDDALPPFDFVVAHGVLTWLSPENTKLLIGLIGQLLRPGGLLVVSSNNDWDPAHTPRNSWLGGFRMNGEDLSTLAVLGYNLKRGFSLVETRDVPKLTRRHARRFTLDVMELSVWRRLGEAPQAGVV